MRAAGNGAGRRSVRMLVLAAMALATAVGSAAARGTTASALPSPCKLLTRLEAQRLLGLKVQPATNLGRGCMYTAYPTGSPGQVELYVDSTLPRTLQIDRDELHHKFWKVPRIGDQALEEEWTIFVRTGAFWITIHVTRLEPWPLYKQRLERAARIASSRIRPAARRAAGLRTTAGVRREPPASGGRERWTGKERRFGGSITNYAGVVYQPSVVLIGGGANAIRSESPDGLTWTIDAAAPGASDLRLGKIMLATTFAAGRVLKVTRVGPNLRVVLGPVKLTDVIRDGTFESKRPISLSGPIMYKTTLPGKASKPRRTQGTAAGACDPRGFTADAFMRIGEGIGVSVLRDTGAGRLAATVQLYMGHPSAEFHIRIGGGRLVDAGFQLHALGGLRYELWGATLDGSGNACSGPVQIPGSFTFPLVGPFAITLTHSFDASMQFSGRATVRTRGDYLIRGTLGFGYDGGRPQRKDDALDKQTRTPMEQNTLSLGVGENALSLGYAVQATIGVGAVGFSAGVWGKLRAGLALVADGSGIESLKLGCSKVSIDVTSQYGVGYTIADYVVKPINALLRVFGATPIKASGGPSWPPFTVWHPPQAEWCPPRK